ncbi:hypothetical protein SAMN04488502_104102 [Dendrosporobacter quercicolus]|uniref:Cof subfamily of IIB subfamily of haloacid dehalogenase superfamily/HAD-superfamily hydrolase, subfamily IIB n=1 Tax=Dendrosporobacter quercicolus TaxID=146817 RepID=A0A1G9SSL7_9FIRM|nr:Cof-type HAD-IIB family hydrolase [Dendrosporobacter quercicolus]SDM38354.1 hypothetical protein SAMN04488502_104102 [Dendrosporobacter quercicolus]
MNKDFTMKLVVLDLDGTLLDEKKEIPPQTMQTIRNVQEKGIAVTLASSRPLCSMLPYARALQLDLPLIAHSGAIITGAAGSGIRQRQPLNPPSARLAIELLEKHEYYIKAYCDDILYVQEAIAETIKYSQLYGVPYREVGKNNLTGLPEIPIRLMMFDRDSRRIERIPELLGDLRHDFSFANDTEYGLEMVDCSVNKGNAVKLLCDELGLEMREVMAIGNEGNDVEMIKMAGLGIAMGNACTELKRVAAAVTKSNIESGVEYALKKYILEC